MMLYIHLPFCKQKCKYCAFCSGEYSFSEQEAYISKLISFLDHHFSGEKKKIRTVYIGGGTPGCLPLTLWEKLMEALHRNVSVETLEEFTVELNPESTTRQLLAFLKTNGVNRLSFGVQSLCGTELALIGRLHTADEALSALRLAAQMGFDNISADLIYGLPTQTPESFEYSLRTLLGENIVHLSCYNLQLEEGTPLYLEADSLSFPEEEKQMEMYDILLSVTCEAGFSHYEISNFCKEGRKAIHNSGYWTGEDYLGLGTAAHSKLGNTRLSFNEDIYSFINKEDFSFDEEITLTEQDIVQEQIMLSLRTDRGVDLSLVDREKAERFVSLGLGAIRENRFILNDYGFMLSNSIICELI